MSKSNYEEKLYNREALMMDVTEDLLIAMEKKSINKTGLAKLLSKSKSFITQTLSGSRNITLRTLADMADALDLKVSITFEPKYVDINSIDKDQPIDEVFAQPDNLFYINTTSTKEIKFSKPSKELYGDVA